MRRVELEGNDWSWGGRLKSSPTGKGRVNDSWNVALVGVISLQLSKNTHDATTSLHNQELAIMISLNYRQSLKR